MVDSIRLIQTGDLHLGNPFSFAPEKAQVLQKSQLDTFWSIIRLCQEQQADVLLIAGDLFDQPVPDRGLVRQVCEMLGSLKTTQVLITPGNHDPLSLDSPYRTTDWPESVHIFGDQLDCFELADRRVRIYGIGFTATVTARPLLAGQNARLDLDYVNLLLIHGDLYASSAQSPYNALTPGFLADLGFDYIALGHVHQFSDLITTGRTTMAYAGCPFGRGFDETGAKGVIAGSIQLLPGWISSVPGQLARAVHPRLDLSFAPLDSRRFVVLEIDISACRDQSSIADLILAEVTALQGERYREHLYKIVLVGEVDEGFAPIPAILQQRLEGQVCYFKLLDRTKKHLDLSLMATEHSLRGAFIRQACSLIEQARVEQQGPGLAHAQRALELGLKVLAGEDVTYAAD